MKEKLQELFEWCLFTPLTRVQAYNDGKFHQIICI